MDGNRTYVIVGAGHAGGRAAQAMRQFGFEGRIVLVGEEPHVPYERPPLSKELIVGDAGLEKVRLHEAAWYAENRIELIAGSAATALDAAAKTVELADGQAIGFDRLMLTTGARVRRLPVPGADLDGVFYLRTIEDSAAIRAHIRADTEVAVIGAGFIGLEIAGSAVKRGARVTVLEAADRPMSRSVAPEVADWFARMHRERGVDLRFGVSVAAIEGRDAVKGVRLGDGSFVPAEVVVVGIGILPNAEIAEAAGLAVDNGVVVDDRGQTSHPDVYAAGDVANQPNAFAGRRLRLESYQNAQDQAAAVARNLCGADEAYEDSLWVWSDQHDVNLQMAGAPEAWDSLLWRGDPEEGRFTVFYMAGARIAAVNTVDNGREMRPARMMMETGKVIDPAILADTSVKLLKLARG